VLFFLYLSFSENASINVYNSVIVPLFKKLSELFPVLLSSLLAHSWVFAYFKFLGKLNIAILSSPSVLL